MLPNKNSILLFYSTCTNDLIIYSIKASNIELFIFIECNRLFCRCVARIPSRSYYYNRVQAYNAIKAAIVLFDLKPKCSFRDLLR
jgi:hypothetical protein